MEHGTTILFGMAGLGVRGVEVESDGTRVVHAVTADETAAACPSCGVLSTSLKQNRTIRPKDLPYGQQPLRVRWHKRAAAVSGGVLSPQDVHRVHHRGPAGGTVNRAAAPGDGRRGGR